jgi:lipopolysaccharide transport system ATP-binding protein
MSDLAIRVENLGKQYRIGGQQAQYRTLREALVEAAGAPFRRLASVVRGQSSAGLDDTIWALKDVSFEVKHGEVLGIIGRNGAGKTTLLKILSRITMPTEGAVDLYGRVGSLLEVGTGFHPELTGRENIYLNGAILGMKRAEIERKFDEIVAFSEIEKFLDTPVKHYSSGMYVRLAFAVAAHLEPEILLVDEVLAVGDAAFQKKCLGKMGDLAETGRTVLFVSHNMAVIRQLCPRSLWMHNAHLRRDSNTEQVICNYLTSNIQTAGQQAWTGGVADPGVTELKINSVRLRNSLGQVAGRVDVRESFSVEVDYDVLERWPVSCIGVFIDTAHGVRVFDAYDSDDMRFRGPREPGSYVTSCEIPGQLLNPGRYFVSVYAGMPKIKNLAHLENVLTIDIEFTGDLDSHTSAKRKGILYPKFQWERNVLCKSSHSSGR